MILKSQPQAHSLSKVNQMQTNKTGHRFDIGFLGGGQLARMSIQAAQRMGLNCLSLDPGSDTPASQIAPAIQAPLHDPDAIAQVLAQCAVTTLENEFIPATAIDHAVQIAQVNPSSIIPGSNALATIQDKLLQSQALTKAGVPAPLSVPIDPSNPPNPTSPIVLKARFGGYDGKGTRFCKTQADFQACKTDWSNGNWMTQEFVPFQRELAVMVYRSKSQTGTFPTMETVQTNHVCDIVFPNQSDASQIAIAAVEAIDGYGLYGVELFQVESGDLLINEIAPRPHNTGHYTLDWGDLSQFDVHIRLSLGIPIPILQGQPAAMANLLGQHDPKSTWQQAARSALQANPDARFHWYGKAESRPGRKMGHINATGPNALKIVQSARSDFYRYWQA